MLTVRVGIWSIIATVRFGKLIRSFGLKKRCEYHMHLSRSMSAIGSYLLCAFTLMFRSEEGHTRCSIHEAHSALDQKKQL